MTTFISPASEVVSGGHVYNRAVLEARSGDSGEAADHVRLPGDWPDGPGTATTLASALAGCASAVVDGLAGAAHPEVLDAAERAGTRITLLIHLPLPDETGLSPARREDLARRERAAVLACSRVVATSRTAAADLAQRYGREDVIVAAPGARPAPESNGSTPPLVLCLAAIVPRKNHRVLAEALGLMGHRSWTAVFAGPDGDHDTVADVESALVTAGVADRVSRPGEVGGAALEELWDSADVLVLPSLAETYGLVVTEALARGVPVVVAAGTGAVEALGDGPGPDPGIAVDARDPRALALALDTVLSDPTWKTLALRRRPHLRGWTTPAEILFGPTPSRHHP
ncbi:glycosyltransferase family 4 protein [Mobilicoccus caccae]|uniref:Glycosyl transferase n=1 Tax=Mobilicoccus caccae TaxID=1859295 RepID=A0ABQ6IMC1_9MICO|nr:glycosyltransferase family 4 protein [Mobilicoccus caccae]GMA38342.1 glycosyl transferase [Mobilicoccus caccae]